MKLAAILLTLVLVEGRMVTRREQNNKVVAEQAGELSKVEVEEVNNRVARQAGEGEQEERQAGPFDLFGQVISSFGGLLGQLASVGGEFISDQQRLNQPVHEELGNIGGTISRSGFVQGATSGVSEVPKLIGMLFSGIQTANRRDQQADA